MCSKYFLLLGLALLLVIAFGVRADDTTPGDMGTIAPTNNATTDQPERLNTTETSDSDFSSLSINNTQINATDASKPATDMSNSTAMPTTASPDPTPENSTATPQPVTELENSTATVETNSSTTSNFTQDGSVGTTPSSTENTSATPANETSSAQPAQSSSESPGEPSTAGSTSTKKPSDYSVRISETNMLFIDAIQADSLFIELKGQAGEDLTGLWLVVHDALSGSTTPHFTMDLTSVVLDDKGFYLLNNGTGLSLTQELASLQAVLIGLYVGEPGTTMDPSGHVDVLLYSSHGGLDQSLEEKFVGVTKFPITLDYSQLSGLNGQEVSLSRCSDEISNAAFVVSAATPGLVNQCSLSSTKLVEMLLTLKTPPCPDKLPADFRDDLLTQTLAGMNTVSHCGVSSNNIDGVQIIKSCIGKHMTRVDVHFTLRANLQPHLALLEEGYKSFVSAPDNRVVHVAESDFLLDNCTHLCRPPMVNPHNENGGSDHKTQVTVGVVLTCVGVFIVVLLAVVFYMKRKRRGILQFRMTRLDEDDDDIMGDMDDFVGNQGPTFRNFR